MTQTRRVLTGTRASSGFRSTAATLRDVWGIRTPQDAVAAYRLITEAMSRSVIGHESAIRTLAITGVRHLLGARGQRMLLVGPHGVGKSTLLRALADALDVPFALLDLTMMSEQNWHGYDLSAFLNDFYATHGNAAGHGVLLLDEADKLAAKDMTGVGSEYRHGKQQSLLPLLGVGSPIPISGSQFDAPRGC